MTINIKTKEWFILFIYILFILSSLPFMPEIWKILRENFGQSVTYIPHFLAIGFFWGFIIYISCYKKKKLLFYFWLVLFFIIYFLLMEKLELPAERIHLLEYGLLGYFTYRALENDLTKKSIYLWAPFLVLCVSILDEGIQYLLPNRVGDLKDTFLNEVSGILGLMITGLIIRSEYPIIKENKNKPSI